MRHLASSASSATRATPSQSTRRRAGGANRSIHGSRFFRLASKTSRPEKLRVGSVKTQSSSYSSAVISPLQRYSLEKSTSRPRRTSSTESASLARARGARSGFAPPCKFTRRVSDETTPFVAELVLPKPRGGADSASVAALHKQTSIARAISRRSSSLRKQQRGKLLLGGLLGCSASCAGPTAGCWVYARARKSCLLALSKPARA
mmetsp:Transcript_1788/g.5282  ORF Transcript_1788/g.5282 Transcript_1788/m.5282 type:complete len:205 (+) Transcript_1788:132-746(+)